MVDARAGITPLDEDLAALARSTHKTVFVAAKKVYTARLENDALEFALWGFDEVFPVSAEHGNGVAEMLDAVLDRLPAPEASEERAHEVRRA